MIKPTPGRLSMGGFGELLLQHERDNRSNGAKEIQPRPKLPADAFGHFNDSVIGAAR